MRYLLILMTGMLAATAVAEPIHYEQIPADVTSYFHFDMEQLLASRLSGVVVNDVGTVKQNIDSDEVNALLGGPIKSGTIFSSPNGAVLLLHASAKGFRDQVEAPHSTNTIVFDYHHQEVHFSSTCLIPGLFGDGGNHDSSKADHGSHISLGLEGPPSQFHGAFYTAYVGTDLIVLTTDLPAMAEAIDVLQGSKPSLAQQDPQGMKAKPDPGVIAVGAGGLLSGQWSGINLNESHARGSRGNATTGPVNRNDSGFGLNLFDPLKGKARLARFDAGEDDRNEYINITFLMTDADSATQLKNLILGVKAFVQLSHNANAPLVDPLEVESNGSDVNLHWAIATAKLSELFHISQSTHGHRASTSIPATSSGN